MANTLNTAVAGVETALALITTDGGYNYDIGNSEFFGAEPVVSGSNPVVYIISASDETTRYSSSKLYKIVTVRLRGITPGLQNRSLREAVAKLDADIETAMYSDMTLGGAVTTLRKTSTTWEAVRETNHAALEVTFELDIHYTEGTP